MNQIEFIPLIEPATKTDQESEIYPGGNSLINSIEWDIYQKRKIEKTYLNFPEPILSGIYQYKLFDIDIEDIERVINLHIVDTDIDESISLFGGYAISINGAIELFPQCCGLLEEIQTWKKLLQEDFEDFYLPECHPSPLICKKGSEIIIQCKDDNEAFIPLTTKKEITLVYSEAKTALLRVLNDLTNYSIKLNSLSEIFKTRNIADIIIWGKNESEQY